MKTKLIAGALIMSATNLISSAGAASFGDDIAFLKNHTEIVVLRSGAAEVAIVPGWQGRVMTSTAGGEAGRSYGWINRNLIVSGKLEPHMNAFGGEDRFWMGPEGGQFSIYFAPGKKFELANWFVPAAFDTLPFKLVSHSADRAEFASNFALTNYSGTQFELEVNREVRLLDTSTALKKLKLPVSKDVSLVAYESDNRITNTGREPWEKETGLLSIWILSMYNPSPSTTIVVPIKSGPDSELGPKVTSDYFGNIPPERLVVKDKVIFLSGDGNFRSKIGINPKRSKQVIGSYDAANKVLTVVQFTQPEGVTDYVNSLWKIQEHPYGGDVANSYNDGPPSPGAKPLGPFFEIESSSPAAALAPGKSLSHIHRTFHFSGPEPALDTTARAVFGVSLEEIKKGLKSASGAD